MDTEIVVLFHIRSEYDCWGSYATYMFGHNEGKEMVAGEDDFRCVHCQERNLKQEQIRLTSVSILTHLRQQQRLLCT
jgi:hypothetical protein